MHATTQQDPALVELFADSVKSFETDKQHWLAKLDASAARAKVRPQLNKAGAPTILKAPPVKKGRRVVFISHTTLNYDGSEPVHWPAKKAAGKPKSRVS